MWVFWNAGSSIVRRSMDGCWKNSPTLLWSESFQPVFEKLSTAVVWIQIYHLHMELWGGEILELVASQFGRILKVDEHTLDHSWASLLLSIWNLILSNYYNRGPRWSIVGILFLFLFFMKNYQFSVIGAGCLDTARKTALSLAVTCTQVRMCHLVLLSQSRC